MYTEKSVSLKNDFYTRYGETTGKLYFEKTGLPCVVLNGDTHKLMFSLDCCVRAYGRGYGDVLKIMDTQSNVCDVHFVAGGKGAQVLYRADIPDVYGMKKTILYTVNKMLVKMGSSGRILEDYKDLYTCDMYASKGWCAVKIHDEAKSVPLPISDYNILLIHPKRFWFRADSDMYNRFNMGERERVKMASDALRACNTDAFFDIINESQKSIERLLLPTRELIKTVHLTYGIDGVDATRICDSGIISFCKRSLTDNVIRCIKIESEKILGTPVRISVVK